MPLAFDFNRSVTGLDSRAARSGVFTPGIASLNLHADRLADFNATLARINAAAGAYSAEQITAAARRLLRSSTGRQEAPFIRVRMRRAREVVAAINDTRWRVAPRVLPLMQAIVAYLEAPERSLIPRAEPVIGNLDCAILVDAGMDAMRADLNDYADFCRYRAAEAARLGVPADALAISRDEWQVERDAELVLDRHLRRIRCGRYTQST